MLKTEQNTTEMQQRIENAAEHLIPSYHRNNDVFFEHGQHFITCMDCGASWSVVDAEGVGAKDGFGVEEIDGGDESCLAEN